MQGSSGPYPSFNFTPFLFPYVIQNYYFIPLGGISNAWNIQSPPLYLSVLLTPVNLYFLEDSDQSSYPSRSFLKPSSQSCAFAFLQFSFIHLSNKYLTKSFLNCQALLDPRDIEMDTDEDMMLALKDLPV